jgi:hypothetical protein
MTDTFPDLGDWRDTRRALHAWSRVLSSVRGSLAEPHPHWWHISLTVTPNGLSTGPLGDDGPAAPAAELDLQRHELILRCGDRILDALALSGAPGVDLLASWLLDRLRSGHGTAVELATDTWRRGSVERYLPESAERYHRALRAAGGTRETVRQGLAGVRGPVQLWAHHFDLAFELFGNRRVEAKGESQPAQIGFGFFPGDDNDPRAYFYGTPWPFTDDLMEHPLPRPACWQKDPWEGARLPYSAAVADGSRVGAFLRAVYAGGRSVLRE